MKFNLYQGGTENSIPIVIDVPMIWQGAMTLEYENKVYVRGSLGVANTERPINFFLSDSHWKIHPAHTTTVQD